ncbi:purine nucleoside [Fusarium beomiforme]|uniref:Purine nucleoside n=1 Tax=Fusarium beomiforme TaxID=44412 RepID=A0A9P5ALK5_9HYPO|nr:purine nucleoside [Fusarium beomiforme]
MNRLLLSVLLFGYGIAMAATDQGLVKPKIMILANFPPEEKIWHDIPDFDILARPVTVPGISPLYPKVHCTSDGDICKMSTGLGQVNAATTMAALVYSGMFDLTQTYFLIASIAGINPTVGTLNSVVFSRYVVQIALQYEFDIRDLPENYTTGYIPLGSKAPGEYPRIAYGTEVFELNASLRDMVMQIASQVELGDSEVSKKYRAKYAANPEYKAAAQPPRVFAGDCVEGDNFWTGRMLSEAFSNYTKLITNGTGVYTTTAMEDAGTLNPLLRAAKLELVDFGRIILMRAASNFDRPPPGRTAAQHKFWTDEGSFESSLGNVRRCGLRIIQNILQNWDSRFSAGIPAKNYIGDILGTLGGKRDFGPEKFGYNPILDEVEDDNPMPDAHSDGKDEL